MPRDEPHQITLKQIAAAAGVSLATTSYALRNDPRIPRATASHVQTVAKRLGYRPNPRVSALMAHIRSAQPVTVGERIAFLWLDVPPGARPYQRMFEGAQARSKQLGYDLEEFWLETPGLTPRRLQQILYSRGIAGLIISPRCKPDVKFQIDWNWNLFSPVILGTAESVPELHHAAHHHYDSMRLAMLKLQAEGQRRIAAVLDAAIEDRVRRLWTGAFLAHHPIREEALDFLALVNSDQAAPYKTWLQRLKPDAVIGLTWMIKSLELAGWRRPAATKIVLLDWAPNPEGFGGIDQREAVIASNAVDIVAGQLHRNERGVPKDVKLLLSIGRWMDGN